MVLAFGASSGQESEPESGGARKTTDLIFEFPEGSDGRVVTGLTAETVTLELPRGTSVPVDLTQSAGGLLASSRIVPVGEDRILAEIELDASVVEQILYQPNAVVLRLGRISRDLVPAVDDQRTYRLGPDDKILIVVDGHPDLTQQLVVRRNGKVAAPLVGETSAAGLTVQELSVRLTDRLREDFLVDPKVDVEVVEYNSQWVVVSGEVRLPGRVALRGGTRLTEVIAEAGGLTDEAGQQIVVSHVGEDDAQGNSTRIERRDFETGAANPVLSHGDLVNVGRVEYCYVDGEVRNPGRVEIEPGLTLLKAIVLSGGATEWANRKEVRILSSSDSGKPGTTHNLKRIQAMKDPDPELRPGDVVIVPRRFL